LLIEGKLMQLACQPITPAIENEAIRLRRHHTIKLRSWRSYAGLRQHASHCL